MALAIFGGSGLCASGALAADAAAAPAPDTTIQEVVVHARAREEKLLEVPVSVQSFSATKLAANNINDLNSLQAEAGFTFNSQGASYSGGGREFPNLIFRGMSSNYGGAFGGNSGALFVDGIYISGGLASVTLADAAQTEVLKGPQNVYFGKNTFGGAINLITSNPSEDFHAKATVGYSDKGSYDDVASVEGAIIPGLLTGRLTGEAFHQGRQYRSPNGGTLGEEDTKGITAVLYATPAPGLWFRGRVHYSHDEDSTAQDGFLDPVTYGTSCGLVHPYFCNGVPTLATISPSKVLSGATVPASLLTAVENNSFGGFPQQWLSKTPGIDHSGLSRDNLQTSLSGGADLPYDSTFKFNVGYAQASADDLEAADHTGSPFFITNTATISRDIQADARLLSSPSQPLRGVLGASYFHSVNQLSQGGYYGGFISPSFATPLNSTDETEAGYGSLDYDILPHVTVTGELRYQHDNVTNVVGGLNISKSYNHTLPRVIVKYEPEKSTTVYLSYSEGVQPPQLQNAYIAAQSTAASSGHPYLLNALSGYGVNSAFTGDPTVKVWEVGLKKALFDNRLTFSVDYFDEEWNGALVNTFIFDAPTCPQGTVYAANSSAACPLGSSGQAITGTSNNHIRGIEFDGNARLTDNLTGHLAFNWTDAYRKTYDDASWGAAFPTGVVPSQNGNRINLVPAYQASADLTYKAHLVGPYDWYAHGLLNYTGPQFVDSTDIAKINGYARVNISAGVTRGNTTFEAFVTNLFDDKNWDMAVRFPGDPAGGHAFSEAYVGAIVTAPNPRDVGIKISTKY